MLHSAEGMLADRWPWHSNGYDIDVVHGIEEVEEFEEFKESEDVEAIAGYESRRKATWYSVRAGYGPVPSPQAG
jgi:hypothetical protein